MVGKTSSKSRTNSVTFGASTHNEQALHRPQQIMVDTDEAFIELAKYRLPIDVDETPRDNPYGPLIR